MPATAPPHVLVNLPPGFFTASSLAPQWARLRAMSSAVVTTSHNTPAEIIPDLAPADAVIMWSWPKLLDDVLDAAPRLKFAGKLDVTQASARVLLRRGIATSLSRGGFSPAVSELALGLILNCLRRFGDYHAAMRVGTEPWVRAFPDDIDVRERQLTGRTVAIVGLGGVGRRLAELLTPFHCKLLVVDPFVPDEVVARFAGRRVTIGEAVGEAEVLVVCAASNDGSRHLLGRPELMALRPGAVLVNVARAALVDTPALVERLARNDMVAAIDVFDTEPLPADHPLRALPNAYLTPHRAGGLIESVQRIIGWLIDDLEAHLAGTPRRYPLVEAMVPSLDT